jgi:hypothetical protein
MRRFPFPKSRTVAGNASSEAEAEAKAALELNACRAENDALRAQVADLLRRLDEAATLVTTATSDSSIRTQAAEAPADEVRTLREENARLLLGARRDSETIARLADEIRSLTHLAAKVVIAARTCRPSAKGSSRFFDQMSTVGSSAELSEGMTVESSIDERSMMESSVGTTVGEGTTSRTSVGSSVESSVRSSVGLSVRSSEGSSVESSTGSSLGTPGTSIGSSAVSSMGSVGLRVRNAPLHAEARSLFETIETLAEEARVVGGGNGVSPSFRPSPIRHVRAQNMRQDGGLVSGEGVKRQGRGMISLKSSPSRRGKDVNSPSRRYQVRFSPRILGTIPSVITEAKDSFDDVLRLPGRA